MKVHQWIERAASAMEDAGLHFGHGTDNAGDEAAWLILHVLGAAVDGSFQGWEDHLTEAQVRRADQLLATRIEQGVPLAYLLGRAYFAGLEFEVDERVLVPRSPIAELVLEHFAPWVEGESVHQVLDLCTGSGCIGVAIAVHLPWVSVDAADISEAALDVAGRNVRRHGVESRVRLVCSDLFAALAGCRYDLIVTNPPYIPAQQVSGLPVEYRAEPALGLVSGDDGLEACLRILRQAADHLHDNGLLVCEVGESEERLVEALPEVPFAWLEFEHGGSGVFLLTREQLINAQPALTRLANRIRSHVG